MPRTLYSPLRELVSDPGVVMATKAENTAVGIRHADHVASSIREKLALTSLTSGSCSVGIVRLRTEAMKFFYPTEYGFFT
jgi:hypothetical protein